MDIATGTWFKFLREDTEKHEPEEVVTEVGAAARLAAGPRGRVIHSGFSTLRYRYAGILSETHT